MHRIRPTLAAAAALAALAAGAAPAEAATPRLSVVGTEFAFKPARPVVRPGLTIIQLRNNGEERHNLSLRRLNARGRPTGPIVTIGPIRSGRSAQKSIRLVAGRYSMVCTIGDHASQGMVGRLTVRKPA